jgi:zeaxanthin glucosyltransferase
MHFGIISPPVPGHIHPFGALGRELIARGHTVTLIHMADLEQKAASEGLRFVAVGQTDHPTGSLPASLRELGRLKGLSALRFTVQAVTKTTEMMCRDAPNAIRREKIQVLLVDQTEPAGGSVAEHLGLPFITVCNALALNRDPVAPPPFTGWGFGQGHWRRARNWIGYAVSDRILAPVTRVVAAYRNQWKLPPYITPEDSFSTLAQISQMPPAFDYPREALPPTFHYVGPLRRAPVSEASFPWHKLDGRPLIYASLGTLQQSPRVFRCFAEACVGMDAQLVIAHGGGLDETSVAALPGHPLAVNFAPQQALLKRAALTLTHAGLNTVLDSLAHAVPMIAVPLTYEQPAIAERIRWSGTGRVISFKRLTAAGLRRDITAVLNDPSFRANARRIADSIATAGGVARAADIVETAVR